MRKLVRFFRFFILIIFPVILSFSSLLSAQTADLILINGKIITVDENDTIAEAIAVKDGLILAVGTNDEILEMADADTEIMNITGYTVTPGIIDAHSHLMYYGQCENQYVNLRPPDVTSIDDILEKIEERINQAEDGEWIMGDGFFQLDDGRLPTKADLDPISPNNPVFLTSIGGHYGTANSYAFDIAGVTADTPNPTGGIIEKDSLTGEPDGILWNHPAMDLVRLYHPSLNIDELAQDVLFAQEYWLKEGITSFQDVNTRGATRYLAYEEVKDQMKVRGSMYFTCEKSRDVDISAQYVNLYVEPMLSSRGDKFLLDGQPPTSYTYEYHPGPSWNLPTWNVDTVTNAIIRLHELGHQIAIHVMGDAAIDLALDAIEAAQGKHYRSDARHRLEHIMLPTPEAIDRMKTLGIVASIQPAAIFISGDAYIDFWGEERCMRLKPFKTFLQKGIPVALGSDYPTVPHLSPLYAIQAALVRKTSSGYIMNINERVSIREALYAHTMGSAYAAFEEDVKGSLEPGKYADMVVWEDDFYTMPVAEIINNEAIYTIVGGAVYDNTITGIDDDFAGARRPRHFRINQNYPNPFNPTTTIKYELPRQTHVKISVYNILGKEVDVLVDGIKPPGYYKIEFNASDYSSGVYIYPTQTEKFSDAKKMILVK